MKKRLFGYRAWRRLLGSAEGATAIEFAILAVPFLMIVFATFETFVAFTGEQVIANAVDTMARQLKTGQITYNLSRSTDMTQTQFRQAFCTQISLLITCSTSEAATPAKLYIDLRQVTTFASIPTTVPLKSTNGGKGKDLDTTGFAYTPGGAGTINMMRVYYRWSIMTDLVRPYISNIMPEGQSSGTQVLVVATTAFQNENYP